METKEDKVEENYFSTDKIEKGNNYSIYYTNLDSLINKKSEVIEIVNNESPDIIAFTEILNKKNPTITKAELKLEGYDEFYRDEGTNDKKNKRRGVVLYTKKSLNAESFNELDDSDFKEHIWCKFKTINNEMILIGVIYHSGSSSVENTKALHNLLRSEVFNSFDKIFLTGDFNYPTARWDGTWSNDNDEELYEATRDGFFIQHVDKPTRFREGQQSNILDLVFTRNETDINNIIYSSPIGKSDHLLLKIITSVPTVKTKKVNKKKYDWKNGKYTDMKKHIANIDWSEMENMDINNGWIFVKNKIQESIELFIPKKTTSNKKDKSPWMTQNIKKSVKKKYKMFKRFLETENSRDYHDYVKTRNEVSKAIKKSKKQYEKNIASKVKENPKAFWKFVNSSRKCRENVSALQKEDGFLATSDKDKADILINFFSSVLIEEDTTDIPDIQPAERTSKHITDINITKKDVKEKLMNLNPNKSPGPDKMYPRVLKELNEELSTPLSNLFNKSLKEGKLPDDWKLAEITAIFKKGKRSSPNNYRPVSLTSIICKIMESFIRDAVQTHMEESNLYSNCQHGFRKGKSCTTQLLEVMDDFTNYVENGQDFDVIYLDFKKAFDSVPHERLLMKLKSYGIEGRLSIWIKDFLFDRLQYVRVGNETSNTKKVTSGIPQGSILGPILFLIFINDLPDSVKSVSYIFADDTKVYNTTDKGDVLQEDLISLQEWSNKWKLYFNCTKCHCLHIGNKNPKRDYHFKSNEGKQSIPKCKEEKDLGIVFDESLKFDKHIESIVNKANNVIGLIKRNFFFINEIVFLHLYKALVRPHLEYGQIVWSPRYIRQSKKIENIQRRATKLVPNIRHLPYKERLRRLDLPSLKYRRIRGDMINVYKILNENNCESNKLLSLNVSNYNTRGHDKKLKKGRYKSNIRKFSFALRVTNIWNSLSNSTTNASSINDFKKLLDEDLIHLKFEFD